jgi:hypothetical protein
MEYRSGFSLAVVDVLIPVGLGPSRLKKTFRPSEG